MVKDQTKNIGFLQQFFRLKLDSRYPTQWTWTMRQRLLQTGASVTDIHLQGMLQEVEAATAVT